LPTTYISKKHQQNVRCQEVMDRIHGELSQLDSRKSELKHVMSTLEYIFSGADVASDGVTKVKGKRVMSADARERIAQAQRDRWAKTKRTQRTNGVIKSKKANRGINAMSPHWTPDEEKLIVNVLRAKAKPQDAPEFARSLLKKFPTRTEGAIRQRINRMVHAGVLKAHMNGNNGEHGGVPHQMVEAA
jgi:hypothetical protein